MTQKSINLGTADQGNGDPLRVAFGKVNDNFTELYTALGLVDNTLNLGAFEFTGSVISTTDSSAIVIDQAVTVSSNLTVGGDVLPSVANGGDLGSSARPWRSLYVSNSTIYIGDTSIGVDSQGNLLVGGQSIADVGTAAWNSITGKPTFATVATTGAYADLSGKPTIPTSFSSLVNGSYSASLGADGSLTLPATGSLSAGNIYFSGTLRVGSQSQYQFEEIVTGEGEEAVYSSKLSLPNIAEIFAGEELSLSTWGSELAVKVRNPSDFSDHIWSFGNDGTLTVPPPAPITFTATLSPIYHAGGGDARSVTVTFMPYANGTVEVIIDGFGGMSVNPGYQSGDAWTYTEADHGIPGYTFTLSIIDIGYNNTPMTPFWEPTFGASEGPPYLPTIKSTSAIKLSADTKNWTFGADGKLTTPGRLEIYNEDNVNVINTTGGLYILNTGLDQLAIMWNAAGNDLPPGQDVRSTNIFADSSGLGIEVINDADVSHNWSFDGDGSLRIPGNIKSQGNIDIEINLGDSTLRRWQFGEDGDLTFPDNTISTGKGITIPEDQSLTVNLSASGPGPEGQNNTFKINPESIKLPTGNGIIFSGTETAGNKWWLDSTNKSLSFPDAGDGVYPKILYSVDDNVTGMWLLTYDKSVKITAAQTSTWNFGTDGALTIPGDIKSDGNINIDINLADSTLRRWQFGEDGDLTFPNGVLKIAGNTISNYVAGDDGGSGSQLEVSQSKTVITNGVTNSLGGGGGGPSLISQALFEVSTNGILSSFQVINTLGEGESSLTSEQLTELDYNSFKIGLRITNDLGDGSEPLVAFNGWTFGTVDQQLALTFPDDTVQTTAWTGIANALRSEGNINIEVNLTDSTKRIWQFGEDGALTFPDGTSQTTAYTGGGSTSYTPDDTDNWNDPTVNTIQAALDELAARVTALQNYEIDGGNAYTPALGELLIDGNGA